jgi:catechol 2,3-dioxygenase-like lactoylglutathione lyase family enzyme
VADEQSSAKGEHQPGEKILSEEHATILASHTVPMGFHHIALATRDTEATHRFYTEVMGFDLVKVVASPTPNEGDGWSKHFFYDTGGNGMIAFWEIHDAEIGDDFPTDINAAAGLPWWVNHVAFDAPTREVLDERRARWTDHGHTVIEVDHEFCSSIYIRDPSANLVEFCLTTRDFTEEERRHAHELLRDPSPVFETEKGVVVHPPTGPA